MALMAQSVNSIDMLRKRHKRSAKCAPNKHIQARLLPARAQPTTGLVGEIRNLRTYASRPASSARAFALG